MSSRAGVLLLLGSVLGIFLALDLQRFLQLGTIKSSYSALVAMYRAHPLWFVGGFMAVHVGALALCLPGAVLTMALAGGAIFGFSLGTLIVLTSLTIGDSLGFLAARFLIGGWVKTRYGAQLAKVEAQMRTDGAYYLLSSRLMAAIPFFVVNLTFGAARMPLRIFAPVSFVGLAPATAVYVNAGTQLTRISGPSDVLTGGVLVSLGLLALVPLVARYALTGHRRWRSRGRKP